MSKVKIFETVTISTDDLNLGTGIKIKVIQVERPPSIQGSDTIAGSGASPKIEIEPENMTLGAPSGVVTPQPTNENTSTYIIIATDIKGADKQNVFINTIRVGSGCPKVKNEFFTLDPLSPQNLTIHSPIESKENNFSATEQNILVDLNGIKYHLDVSDRDNPLLSIT